MSGRLRTFAGWFVPTPVELVLVATIVAAVVWGAMPHYRRWRHASLLEDERIDVMRVRSALVMPDSASSGCPAELDTCPDGASASDCAFFSAVLRDPVRAHGWRKSGGDYRGPAGGTYRYDRGSCLFHETSAPPDSLR